MIAATAPLWAPHVFVESRSLSVILLSRRPGRVLPARHAAGHAGRRRPLVAVRRADGTDAVIRVVVAVATVAVGWGLVGFLWATVGGALAWLLLLLASPTTRAVARWSPARTPRHSCAAPRTRWPRPAPARSW